MVGRVASAKITASALEVLCFIRKAGNKGIVSINKRRERGKSCANVHRGGGMMHISAEMGIVAVVFLWPNASLL